jgi:hypothetical protein
VREIPTKPFDNKNKKARLRAIERWELYVTKQPQYTEVVLIVGYNKTNDEDTDYYPIPGDVYWYSWQ